MTIAKRMWKEMKPAASEQKFDFQGDLKTFDWAEGGDFQDILDCMRKTGG